MKKILNLQLAQKELRNFWAKVNKTDGCWIWNANRYLNGYGMFGVGGKPVSAHRVSWMIHFGEIPDDGSYHGICVCHKCDNRLCVNPAHLFLGTAADNVKDRDLKGRHICATKGRPELCRRGADHPNAKLTDCDVEEITRLYKPGSRKGFSSVSLGRRFGVDSSTVLRIVNGQTYQSLKQSSHERN